MDTMGEVLSVLIATVAGALGGYAKARLERREKRCAWDNPQSAYVQRCKAIRYPACNDGRCSYHCSQLCKCTKLGD